MTKIIKHVAEWREFRSSTFFQNKSVGLVATMGNLHAGHESLLYRSLQENDITVLTIFVNPTQFNDPNDLKKYPRTFDEDCAIATKLNVDVIFAPEYSEMYPDGYRFKIMETEFSRKLCGKHRPGHFDGVLTVVMKFFQLVKATRAYFGEKDFQQLQLVSDMKKAFFIDTEIIACPTIRDENNLALSSRNNRLTPEEYHLALAFAKLLRSNLALEEITQELIKLGMAVDYVEEHQGRRFGAVKIGSVRLIDNRLISNLVLRE